MRKRHLVGVLAEHSEQVILVGMVEVKEEELVQLEGRVEVVHAEKVVACKGWEEYTVIRCQYR